ncbi:MAG TPA: hypothetical protein PK971_01165 [Saprospiraceae bacterium]|nr:hypothetical protein [Saprospiraceae bacterium]HND86902.1 hypothetical protein [Saprospiraceae bacterium]
MKKAFVLRIDEETFAALEKWAADEFRSVNGQIEWLLSQAVKQAGREQTRRHPKPPPKPDTDTPLQPNEEERTTQ